MRLRSKNDMEQLPIVQCADGKFRFVTAHYGSWANDKRIVFRVRVDADPKVRAAQKEIRQYDQLLPSTELEIQAWISTHDGLISE